MPENEMTCNKATEDLSFENRAASLLEGLFHDYPEESRFIICTGFAAAFVLGSVISGIDLLNKYKAAS